MSLVGTRPPTVDEWEQYELHHRSRMSTKPGITGMWQVSGRSDITDFEEVVRLDTEYIQKRCDVYDCVNGEIVQVGSIFSLSGYLSLYTKATEEYIANRINTHSGFQRRRSRRTYFGLSDGTFQY